MGPPARRTVAGPQMFRRESCALLQRDSQAVGLGEGSENSGTSGSSRGDSGSRADQGGAAGGEEEGLGWWVRDEGSVDPGGHSLSHMVCLRLLTWWTLIPHS